MASIERKTAYISTYKKLAVQCSAETYVAHGILVLRNYIRAERRQLLVAAKRRRAFLKTKYLLQTLDQIE